MSQPYLFVSYATADYESASTIAGTIEKSGTKIWIDRRGLSGGELWASQITAAIRESAGLVLLCSSASMASRNVRQEVQLAWDHDIPIIPVLLEPVAFPDEFAYFIQGRQWLTIDDIVNHNWGGSLADPERSDLTALAPIRSVIGSREIEIPAPPDPPIGRERELQQIAAMLKGDNIQLVTLTGPGGVGKTRVAIELARSLAESFKHGVVFVDLSSTSDPGLVGSNIAQSMGVAQAASQGIDEILSQVMRSREQLLLLDNFEQVIGAAPLIAELIRVAPGVKILITSREPLRVRGEVSYPIEPLALPDLSEEGLSVTGSPAVALFRRAALAANPLMQETEETDRAIAEICRRLDGLPLAIELAAARVRYFPPEVLLNHLDKRLPVLVSGPRDLPMRQQTLRDTIAWSYDLLTSSEQRLFRLSGVFADSWTFEALQRLATEDSDLSTNLLNDLTSLIDKNLVRETHGGNGLPRFSLLETIQEFALEMLESKGESEAARTGHAAMMTERARSRLGIEYDSLIGLADLDLPQGEIEEIRQAFGWLSVRGDGQSMATIAAGYHDYLYAQGMFEENARMARAVLEQHERSPLNLQAQIVALIASASCHWVLGDHEVAEKHGREALALAEESDDDSGLLFAVLITLAIDLRDQHKFAEAQDLAERALMIPERPGERKATSAQVHLGKLVMMMGDLERAEELLSEAAMRTQRFGNVEVALMASTRLAHTRTQVGDLVGASSAYRQLVRSVAKSKQGFASVFFGHAASLAATAGFRNEAIRLYGYYRANSEDLGWRVPLSDWFEGHMVELREATDPEMYESHYEAGARMTTHMAIEVISSVLDEIDRGAAVRVG